MVQQQKLTDVLARLDKAVANLDDHADRLVELKADNRDFEEEAQRLNADRGRLAEALDSAEARAERLEDVNKEVSRRLVTAMETLRAVLDR
ncbi:MAG: DUF4164 domain-containing protein [Pseudomonadota bacterium]